MHARVYFECHGFFIINYAHAALLMYFFASARNRFRDDAIGCVPYAHTHIAHVSNFPALHTRINDAIYLMRKIAMPDALM